MIVGVDIKASIGTEDDSGWSIGESLDAKTKRQREHLVLGVRIPLSHLDSLHSRYARKQRQAIMYTLKALLRCKQVAI